MSTPWLIAASLAAMSLIMFGGWAFQRARNNGGWTDVVWTFGSGAVLAAATLWPEPGSEAPSLRQALVAALVAVWSVRLGSYIARRVAGSEHEDVRYARIRAEQGEGFQGHMLWFLQIQALATGVLAVSVVLAARHPEAGLGWRDFAGFAVLLAAIVGEGIADEQMRRFKADKANKGKVMDRGLWGWSRHPNYFFEWFGWLAYPVIGLDPSRPESFATLAAPVAMYLLLTRGSGIPPLEQAMLESRGDAFRAYQRRVSAFFPLPPRKGA